MSKAYYNEFDPYAAQWLRNLIKTGLIADGVVDERSIKEVTPDDLKGFTQCHFFAGIGIWSHALRASGWLYCTDGKWRPVRPGSFPLVNVGSNRVGRLRAYGNAINAEVAKEFITSYMEIRHVF